MRVSEQTLYADVVNFGAYQLPRFLVERIDDNTPVESMPESRPGREVSGNQIYVGENASRPSIGDVKVTFTAALPSEISLIAQVEKETFVPFVSKDTGREFSRLSMGTRSAEEMIADAHSDNKFMLWVMRAGGLIALIFSFNLILGPLGALARVIPPLGAMVEFLSGIVASIVGLSWGLVIIAISWLRFRPIIAGACLSVVLGLMAFSFYRKKQKLNKEASVTVTN